MTVEYRDGAFVVRFPFSPTVLAELRDVRATSKRYDGVRREWRLIDPDRVGFSTFVQRHGATVAPDARAALVDVVPVTSRAEREVWVENARLVIHSPYDEALSAAAAVAGGRFDRGHKVWRVPLENCRDVWPWVRGFVGLTEARDAAERAQSAARQAVEESALASGVAVETPWLNGRGRALLPYQHVGVEAIKRRCFALLADKPGLGKTVQSLVACASAGWRGVVVVVPPVVALNWMREARMWLPADWTTALMSSATLPVNWRTVDVLVVPYSRVKSALNAEIVTGMVGGRKKRSVRVRGVGLLDRRWSAVVVDEAHACKERTTERTMLITRLAESASQSVQLLTGTPAPNGPRELVQLLVMLRAIDRFGGEFNFLKRYCDGQQTAFGWDFSGASNTAELHERLRATVMIRREKSDVLKDLPEKSAPKIVEVDLSNRRDYDAANRAEQEWMRAQGGESALSDSATRAAAIVRLTRLRTLCGAGKVKAAVEWIRETLAGEPVVIFAYHKPVQEYLVRAFPGCAAILGDMDSTERQRQIDRFQRDAETDVMVASLRAGGVGWTGTRAAHVVTIELDWTPSTHEQAEDRIHRIGQTRDVTPWVIVASRTTDDALLRTLAWKAGVIAQAVDGAAASGDDNAGSAMGRFVREWLSGRE